MSLLLQRDLERAIDGEVRFDNVSRALYSTDASVYQIEPLGVVVPRSQEAVIQAVNIAANHGVPITPRGGGTSQAGQSIGAGLVMDTSKYLNRIIEINPDERWARVEPGVVLDELNATLRQYQLRFAPDVSSASRATVGGMMANNSSGARSVLYGKTIDHVREQRVVLADGALAHFRPLTADERQRAERGDSIEARAYRAIPELSVRHAPEIERRFPKVLRRVGGYNLDAFVDPARPVDLTRIIVGSEGTLGFITDATIALVPLPAQKVVLTIEFDSVLDALGATPVVLTHRPSAVEVMDDFILSHAREHPVLDAQRRSMIQREGSSLLCVEFYGDDRDELIGRMEAVQRDLTGAGFTCRYRHVIDLAKQARIWSFREAALGLSTAMKSDAKAISFVEDTAVAPEKLRDYIERFIKIVQRHRTTAGIYAHASVGCLHVRPVVNLKTVSGVAKFESIANEVANLVLEFGGALSGEHGDGLVRGAFNEKMFGSELYQAFRAVKHTFDPNGLFNPGRIVDTPSITSHLRFGAGYRTPVPRTTFDFSDHDGFGRAVEMCSGVGLCRKTREGTMCPSYMVTREEAHSTRGRANALRLAMIGALGSTKLSDKGVHDVLDLCLECRACKSECPTGVDMARYKSEFLAGYWERHRMSLRAHTFGHAHATSAIGSRFAPLSNVIANTSTMRWVMEKTIGVDRRRTLPRWTRNTLSRALKGAATSATSNAACLLFVDTFTEYERPDIGLAAIDVMKAAGIDSALAPNVCCGRPLISQGLLSEARRQAAANVHALFDAAARGHAIVFLEPSCLSAVREDAPDLLRGELQYRARVVAREAVLFEEYLERECAAGRATLKLNPGPANIHLHPHCHQRSMGLAAPARALLSRVPGAQVVDLDAGCCGMAGSFGYTRDHYDVSRAIGERKLLPAARALEARSVLVASGTSCRHQVHDLAGVDALHAAVLLRSLL
ncbi:MAG TPA: FAD-linked oxidase C-terminal domain-containing protein [Vicinamibacterales bacterium]|nr:FAD-linked oxidase C-terminal domain-containing protein [Vicinamibacterales bacterium]